MTNSSQFSTLTSEVLLTTPSKCPPPQLLVAIDVMLMLQQSQGQKLCLGEVFDAGRQTLQEQTPKISNSYGKRS